MSTILVVDDEPTLLALVAELLREGGGHTVVTARDGLEALEVFAREVPDLVLMDVMMPVLDGRSAYRALRARIDGAAARIVLMSASHARNDLDPGLDGFLAKPFHLADLLALVERVLSGD